MLRRRCFVVLAVLGSLHIPAQAFQHSGQALQWRSSVPAAACRLPRWDAGLRMSVCGAGEIQHACVHYDWVAAQPNHNAPRPEANIFLTGG